MIYEYIHFVLNRTTIVPRTKKLKVYLTNIWRHDNNNPYQFRIKSCLHSWSNATVLFYIFVSHRFHVLFRMYANKITHSFCVVSNSVFIELKCSFAGTISRAFKIHLKHFWSETAKLNGRTLLDKTKYWTIWMAILIVIRGIMASLWS